MSYPTYRRWFSLALGTLTGFLYGLISQEINHLFMPGIPLYQPPLGPAGNIALAALAGAALGAVTGWMDSGGFSVLLSSLLGAGFMSAATLLSGQDASISFSHRLTAVAIIFVPTAGLLAPLLIFFRWLVTREETAYRDTQTGRPLPPFRRYYLPVALLLTASALGLLDLYPAMGRAVTPRMHQLIQQGLESPGSLPAPFQPPDVESFAERARGPYTLQWAKDYENQFAIPRPAGDPADQSTVIARFDNGYLLVCMFPGKTGTPTCRDF
jgi:hypothetical protein